MIGAGPIGLLHLMLLKSRGASVAVADPHEGRLRKARAMGADRLEGYFDPRWKLSVVVRPQP